MTIKNDLKRIRNKLRELVKFYNVNGLKGGTEVEDMSFEEIILLQNICCDIVPLTIKIGGCEARNDIRFLLKQGIDGVLAPMVETPYSLHNFLTTLKSLTALEPNSFSIIAINIETITAYKNQRYFENHELYPFLTNITVGRTDLSASCGLYADDGKIFTMAREIVERAKKDNKITSVGGRITADNIEKIRGEIIPDNINTRHVSFSLTAEISGEKLQNTIQAILHFEISLFRLFSKIHLEKKKFYEKRIRTTMQRMQPAIGKISA